MNVESLVDSQTFLSQVRDHGFLNEEQISAVSQRFPPEAPLHEVAAALVDQGWMTSYQVERIWAGQAKGLVLGQYRILAELGRGGFGCVFKARHLIMNRVVALKVISPELVDDSRAREWFRREVLATTQLQHPNIVMAYDANEVENVLFLVMEYVDGHNLAEVVKKQGPLPIGLACALLLQAARGLQYAHEMGMVHRDIKPANLLIPRTAALDEAARAPGVFPTAGQVLVKIVDFGLARLQSQGSLNTLVGLKEKNFVGTPDYVSPEQARNIHDVDIRSDLYSLGCTFFFALTGRPPFKGKSPLETVLQHLEHEVPSLEALRREIPPALVSIVRRLLAKKPEQRFQTPKDLVAELNFFFGSGALLTAPATAPAAAPGAANSSPMVSPPVDYDPRRTHLVPMAAPTWAEPMVAETKAHAFPELPTTDVMSLAVSSAGQQPAVPDSVPAGSGNPAAPAANSQISTDWTQEELRFAQLWRAWSAVVEGLVQGRAASISDAEYRSLHADLVAAARNLAEQEKSPAVFRLIETLLAPWLSLPALSRTDPQTLASLLQRCWQAEQQLGLRPPSPHLGRWAVVAVLFLLSGLLGGFLIHYGAPTLPGFTLASLWRYLTANALLTLTLVVPPLVLMSVYLFSRLSRSS
jgi:serine/threonine protein kinase